MPKWKFSLPLPSSKEGEIFKKAGAILSELQDEKGFESHDILDLSQGDPCSEPLDCVKAEMKRAIDLNPSGKYRFEIIQHLYRISILRYLVKQGINYKLLAQNAPPELYKNISPPAEMKIIDDLLWDKDLLGENLFLAQYYHDIDGEQHQPFLHTGHQNYKETLIRKIQANNPTLNLKQAAEKLQKLSYAIKKLKILSGSENCKAAFAHSIKLFKGKYVLSGAGIYQSFSDTPGDIGKCWQILDTTDTLDYKITPTHLQQWADRNPDNLHDVNCLLLVDPANPSGAIYSKTEKLALVKKCRELNIPIIEDAIYSGINIKEEKSYTPVTDLYPEGSIVFKSMGKLFSSPGLRIGYAFGAPEFMERFEEYIRNHTGFLPIIPAIGAAAIMEYTPEDYYKKNNEIYRQRINFVKEKVKIINEQLIKYFGKDCALQLNDPEGGYFMLVNLAFLKDKYFSYVDEMTKQPKIGIIKGSMDITRMFIHFKDEQGKVRGVRLPPTTGQHIPDSKLQVRISVGRDDFTLLDMAMTRIKNIIMNTLLKQHELKEHFFKQQKGAAAVTKFFAHPKPTIGANSTAQFINSRISNNRFRARL